AMTMGLYYHLIPHTHHLLRSAVVNDFEDYLYAMLKKDHEIKGRSESKMSSESYEVYVLQVQGRQLKNAIFKKQDADRNYTVDAVSSEAELHVDLNANQLLVRMRHGQFLGKGGSAFFNDHDWTVPLPERNNLYKPSARDMTWQELLQARRDVYLKMDEV